MRAEQIHDLLVVGSGPAGMAAAIAARRGGLSVCVADEAPAPGGQIYRSTLDPIAGSEALGPDYGIGAVLARTFVGSGATLISEATVFAIERGEETGWEAGVLVRGRARRVLARTVLIATGALERPFPIPGWTLPGVMTAGAAQTMLKASGVVPTGQLHLVGTGPLLYLLAAQYSRLGVPVAALLDTAPWGNWISALPHLPAFLAGSYAWKGVGLLREVFASTKIVRNVRDVSVLGDERAEAIRYAAGGRVSTMPAGTVLLHQGVVPQVNLAMASGITHKWVDQRLAFEPEIDESGRTESPGLYVAGDTGGIAGADAARHRGTLAALSILRDLGKGAVDGLPSFDETSRSLARSMRGRAFLDKFYRPPDAMRIPAGDDVVVCRCEGVSAGKIRSLVGRGAQGPNQAKFFSRAGMGPCQGRLCGLTVCETMAAATGRSPGDVGYMRVRAPVKPITVGAMATSSMDAE